MEIEKAVKDIKKLFKEIDNSSSKYLNHTILKCPEGCAQCCKGKNISASPLEYLPYSVDLHRQGLLIEKYWEIKKSNSDTCVLLEFDENTQKGRCGNYQFRGFICRLFGNASMIQKNGEKQFSGCKILKQQIDDNESFYSATQKYSPVYSDFYMRLKSIDVEYGALMLPLNLAILKSMEIIYFKTLE